MQVSVFGSLGHTPGSGILGSYGDSMFKFLRSHQAALHSSFRILLSHLVELFLFPNSWCKISSLSPLSVGFGHLPLGVGMEAAVELPCDSPAFVLFPLPQEQCIPTRGCGFGTQNSNRAAADSQPSRNIREKELVAARTETLTPLVIAAKQPDTPFILPFTLVLFYVFISFLCQIPLHMLLPLSGISSPPNSVIVCLIDYLGEL